MLWYALAVDLDETIVDADGMLVAAAALLSMQRDMDFDRWLVHLAFVGVGIGAYDTLLNAAVVMGLVPTTGLALPFLSHGSNSLICSALAVGILLRASSADEQRPARRLVSRGRTRPRTA